MEGTKVHKLSVINGKVMIDKMQIHGISDFIIKSSTNELGTLVELELKMIVTLDQSDVKAEK